MTRIIYPTKTPTIAHVKEFDASLVQVRQEDQEKVKQLVIERWGQYDVVGSLLKYFELDHIYEVDVKVGLEDVNNLTEVEQGQLETLTRNQNDHSRWLSQVEWDLLAKLRKKQIGNQGPHDPCPKQYRLIEQEQKQPKGFNENTLMPGTKIIDSERYELLSKQIKLIKDTTMGKDIFDLMREAGQSYGRTKPNGINSEVSFEAGAIWMHSKLKRHKEEQPKEEKSESAEPKSDSDKLRLLADYMDVVDKKYDIKDKDVQKDLRRIADNLESAPSESVPVETQEELWKECENYYARQSIIRRGIKEIFADFANQFTLTRKP